MLITTYPPDKFDILTDCAGASVKCDYRKQAL